MTEGVPGNDMPTQALDDILRRLADASQDETAASDNVHAFHINTEAFPYMAEAAERIAKELQILRAQARVVEATAVASSVLWPNAHDDQDVRLLDSGLEQYRSALDPDLYQKRYQELEEALRQARKSYLQTFWTEASTGLIIPSLETANVGFMNDFIAGTLDDPGRFHNTMTESVLPLFASMALKQTPQSGETYLALRQAVEANAVGWVIDPFTVKGHTPTEVKQLIGWDNTSEELLSAVDPFDGYEDEALRSYSYVSFMPRIVGGRRGGRAITELGSRRPI